MFMFVKVYNSFSITSYMVIVDSKFREIDDSFNIFTSIVFASSFTSDTCVLNGRKVMT